MAKPNTRSTLKDYCLRNLGKPVIDINVDEDQIEDRIDEAVQYFCQYHTDGVERMYLKYKVTADDKVRLRKNKEFNVIEKGTYADNIELESGTNTVLEGDGDLIKEDGTPLHTEDSTIVETTYEETQNYLVIPDAVISVINIFPLSDRANLNMFDVRYQLRLNDLYDFSSTSIVHYEMTMRHLDFLDHILVGEKPIRFNALSNRLYIDMDWQEDIDADEYLIIECYRQLDPAQHTNMFNDIYLKRYTTALIKKQWGQNLSKFNGTAMLGGVTLNGPELFSSAVSEVQKLEEEIRLNYEEPPHMQQG
jgi:predicted transcriptional regulator|tara:strand:- start:39 stop:956 length:918 start_codon:yes stop_codon:yes gene_type:complete